MIEEAVDTRLEPRLSDCLKHINADVIDLILVEGFRSEDYPKIEIFRGTSGKDYFFPSDKSIIALASDTSPGPQCPIPVLDINDPDQVVEFIQDNVISTPKSTTKNVD